MAIDAASLGRGIKPAWRRRLDLFGRAAAEVMDRVQAGARDGARDGVDNPAVVFSSRHGNLARTLELLGQIRQQEPLSPAHFSLSVHNALPGVASIAWGITRAHTALAAGPDSLIAGLTETLCLGAEDPTVPCLLVHADLVLPPAFAAEDPATPVSTALALRLEASDAGDDDAATFAFTPLPGIGDGSHSPLHDQVAALTALLSTPSATAAELRGATMGWRISRHG